MGRIRAAADRFVGPGEQVQAVLPTEAVPGELTFLCACGGPDGRRTWIALDAEGEPVRSRSRVREAVSIAAMCEVAEESAGGGDLEELRAQLLTLRLTERPEGIDEAEEAAHALEAAIGVPPRLASPAYLDAVGTATRRLERALGSEGDSPFASAMQGALVAVEELAKDVEANYKLELE